MGAIDEYRMQKDIDRMEIELAERDEIILELRAEVEALRVLLGEAMDELEGVYDEMYPAREEYPNDMRRYEREMRLANRIRAALRGEVNR